MSGKPNKIREEKVATYNLKFKFQYNYPKTIKKTNR